MPNVKQRDDGSMAIYRESDDFEVARLGAKMGSAGSNVPAYLNDTQMVFNLKGGTDTGGGILSWQNTLPYDMIVTNAVLDVQTASSASGVKVEMGEASTPTSATATLFSAHSTTAVGTFNGGAVSVKVAQNHYINVSTSAGTSGSLQGRAFFSFLPSNPTIGGA